jgi:hypothetical protein
MPVEYQDSPLFQGRVATISGGRRFNGGCPRVPSQLGTREPTCGKRSWFSESVPANAHVAGRNSGFMHNRQTAFPAAAVLEPCLGLFATFENARSSLFRYVHICPSIETFRKIKELATSAGASVAQALQCEITWSPEKTFSARVESGFR